MRNKTISVYVNDPQVLEHIEGLKDNNQSVSAFFVEAARFYLENRNTPEDIDARIDERIKALLAEKSNIFEIANNNKETNNEESSNEDLINKINASYED